MIMKIIIGFTDSVNECDCCGKTELKGTYCIELDGVELYYGSVCAFKSHGLTIDEQKEMKKSFNAKLKNENKLNAMELEHNGTEHSLVKMFDFVIKKGLDLASFLTKYGKIVDETPSFIAYSVGCRVKIIDK
jgi:hypothetical protein